MFQLTAARRRLVFISLAVQHRFRVSTHSRPKAAGFISLAVQHRFRVSTHSRPKAAGLTAMTSVPAINVSTHSRPKAAGYRAIWCSPLRQGFQLTAARRRLVHDEFAFRHAVYGFNSQPPEGGWHKFHCLGKGICVSTHSRPKAAGQYGGAPKRRRGRFNSQPPEGGWVDTEAASIGPEAFQLTAARRRLG